MIPSNNEILLTDVSIDIQPSKTYHMVIDKNRINGTCDNADAMIELVYKILNTERYVYPIYSWNYGVELIDLYGQDVNFVCADLPHRIREALTQDERILSVEDFEFDTSQKGSVLVSFLVRTIFGDVNAEKVVSY